MLQRLVSVRPGEGAGLVWSAAHFFFLLAGYSILRPLRDEKAVAGGAEHLPWLMAATFGAMLLGNAALSALAHRVTRRRLITLVYRLFMSGLCVCYALLLLLPEGRSAGVGHAFFVWTNVFNLIAVSLFWSFTVDVFSPEQGLRLFGFLGVGGTLGAICGSAVTAGLAEVIDPSHLMIAAVVMLELAIVSVTRLSRIFGEREATGARDTGTAPPMGGALTGIGLILRSGYLLGICLYMVLFAVTSTLLYFEQARIVNLHLHDAGARTAFFARIDLFANVLTLVIQCLFAGRIMMRLGVGLTLALTPVVTIAGFAGLLGSPSLWTLLAFQVARKGVHYALVRPTREVLFTVLSREEKLKAKNFIDTFLYRGGDMLGAAPFLIPGMSPQIVLVAIPLSLAWLILSLRLGARQRSMAGAGPGAASHPTEDSDSTRAESPWARGRMDGLAEESAARTAGRAVP